MNSFDLVLFISRLSGIAPYVKSHNSRYTKSKAWRWYSLVVCLLVSVLDCTGAVRYFLTTGHHEWFLVAAIPFHVMCTIGMIASIARNQISLLGELLDTLQPAFWRRTHRWLAPLLGIILLGKSLDFFSLFYLFAFFVGVTFDASAGAYLMIFVYRFIHGSVCCLFGVLTLCLANKYAAVNDNLRAAILGPAVGQRYVAVAPYDTIISLRKQHREIGLTKDRLWAMFNVPMTLIFMSSCVALTTNAATILIRGTPPEKLMAVIRLGPLVLSVVLGILAGDAAASEGNETLHVVHECLNTDHLSDKEIEELNVFAMCLYQRPVHILILGLIPIEFPLLIQATGASLSYFLICLQFN